MSNADRTSLAYVKETTYGVTPSAALTEIRHTGESLHQATAMEASSEIRDDRQHADVVRTNANAEGDVNMELSYGVYDDWLQYALQSAAWSTLVTSGAQTDIAAADSPNQLTSTTTDLSVFLANQWVKISGFTTSGNNGYGKVVSSTATTLVLTGIDLADEVAGDSVTVVMGEQIVNGTAYASMSMERHYEDLTTTFANYLGMTINTLALSIVAEQIITGTFGLMGKNENSAAATIGTGGNNAAPTNDVMAAVDDIFAIFEAQVSHASTEFTFSLSNNIRNRAIIGTLGPTSQGSGSIDLSGTLKAYFATAAIMNKYLADTATSLAIVAQDSAGKSYLIDLPNVRFNDGKRVAGGINTDIIADMAWMAKRDPTEGITIRIVRWAA